MARVAILQMTSGIDPEKNFEVIAAAASDAAARGAAMLFTPEMALLVDRDRQRAASHVLPMDESRYVPLFADLAQKYGLHLALGSMAVALPEGRWANRSLLFTPDGGPPHSYDKMHLFDVTLSTGEAWRESAAYAAGDTVVSVPGTPVGRLGLTVCYDLRFPALFDSLGRHVCDALAVPSAFTVPTGKAHWHVLLRARAIEASAYVIAAAQVGRHEDGRTTYGHSLVVDPWGQVVLDMGGDSPGLGFADIDPARIAEVRMQLPSLANRRPVAT